MYYSIMSQVIVSTNLYEMFSQRGYTDIHESSHEDEPLLIADTTTGSKICAFSKVVDKFNVNDYRRVYNCMTSLGIFHGVIIYKEITPVTRKAIKLGTTGISNGSEIYLEEFTELEMMHNPTKHVLVPLHQALSEQDRDTFVERYGAKIPVMREDDRIARFYNFRSGNIIKITRNNGIIVHRIVK